MWENACRWQQEKKVKMRGSGGGKKVGQEIWKFSQARRQHTKEKNESLDIKISLDFLIPYTPFPAPPRWTFQLLCMWWVRQGCVEEEKNTYATMCGCCVGIQDFFLFSLSFSSCMDGITVPNPPPPFLFLPPSLPLSVTLLAAPGMSGGFNQKHLSNNRRSFKTICMITLRFSRLIDIKTLFYIRILRASTKNSLEYVYIRSFKKKLSKRKYVSLIVCFASRTGKIHYFSSFLFLLASAAEFLPLLLFRRGGRGRRRDR